MPSKKLIALIAESDKILFVNVNTIMNIDPRQQQKQIYLYRKTMHYCFSVASIIFGLEYE